MAARSLFGVFLAGLVAASVAAQAQEPKRGDATPVQNFVLTEEGATAFRKYTPIERAILRPGDTLHVYGEPGDFGWHSQDGSARFNVIVTARLRTSDGRAVLSNVPPLSLKHAASSRPAEFFFSLRLKINTPLGSYTLGVRLRDVATGETVEKSFPVRVSYRRQRPAPKADAVISAASPTARPATAGKASRTECRRYFAQIGAMIAVPCEP
jgi:hypothetical protein